MPKAMADAVVDFPLEPVTASMGFFATARNTERSVSTGTPFSLAARRKGEDGDTAGFLMTRSAPVKSSST